jgi:hypothetical protein
MSDHSRLSLEKVLKEEKGLERITNLHLQMMLNVIAIALQKVMEIPGEMTVPPKGKDRLYHNVISAVDQSVNPVVTMCITPMTIANLKATNPPAIVPREDEVAMTAVIIKERAKQKARAKVSVETTANL